MMVKKIIMCIYFLKNERLIEYKNISNELSCLLYNVLLMVKGYNLGIVINLF